eukprot:448020-Pyramimonas_sp.AAC.1
MDNQVIAAVVFHRRSHELPRSLSLVQRGFIQGRNSGSRVVEFDGCARLDSADPGPRRSNPP